MKNYTLCPHVLRLHNHEQKRRRALFGHTDDLLNRIDQHEHGVFEGFSKKYNLKRLVYYEEYETRDEAFTRERQMKKWNRAWKIKLINERNPIWTDLRREFGWMR